MQRKHSNYFHHDGGNIDILGFCFIDPKEYSIIPHQISQSSMTMIIHKQNVRLNRRFSSKQQQDLHKLSINHRLNIKENQILFFNNHHYLHSAPFSVPTIAVQGSQYSSSQIVLVRFSLSKKK
jgi:hypothetical protein